MASQPLPPLRELIPHVKFPLLTHVHNQMFLMFLIGFEQLTNDVTWLFDQRSRFSSIKDLDVNQRQSVEFQWWLLPTTSHPSRGPSHAELFWFLKHTKVVSSASLHPHHYCSGPSHHQFSLGYPTTIKDLPPCAFPTAHTVFQNGNLTIRNSPA